MKWDLRPRWIRQTDEELITGIKRKIDLWDRWRYARFAFAVVLLAAGLWFLNVGVGFITHLDQQKPDSQVIFWSELGVLLGFLVGFNSFLMLNSLALSLSRFRSERLLLKYYDTQQSSEQRETEANQTLPI